MTRLFPLVALALLAGACGREPGNVARSVGTVEVVEVDVAPLVSARVTRMYVDEGDVVRAGDTLAALTLSTIRPDVESRRARLASAEAQLRDLEAGARPAELDRAAAELRAAEADASHAESDVQRLAPLAKSGTVSQQAYDAAVAASRAAVARRDAARQSYRLLQEGTRPERIGAARAEVANARAALAAMEGTASDLVLLAPVPGVILGRHAEPGEVLRAGEPALTLGDLGRPWVRVFVDQRAMPRIRVGDPAVAVLDAYPDRRFPGRVVAIRDKAEFTPRVAFTEEERADLVFGVKVELTDSAGMLKPGLPVTVTVTGSAPAPAEANGDRPASVAIPTKP
ncbi:MAG TPA: HlyD family efflux transporter periplasmic adaptor subunit [Gemmatimonadaceae bacterium]|nr:HlyD family efflux transporter periplasmic adaptor subunit [Gemmatimonadaceae bacterium]